MLKDNQIMFMTGVLPMKIGKEYMSMFDAIRTDQANELQRIINSIPENRRNAIINGKFDFGQQAEDMKRISKCKPILYNIVDSNIL